MKVVSPDQMREIDRKAIDGLGIPGLSLMERAGEAVARAVLNLPDGLPVHCFCGGGNNGGDGFVAARYLSESEKHAEVWLLANPSSLRGDARINYDRARSSGIPVRQVAEPGQLHDQFRDSARRFIAVDALLGTGAHGSPRGLLAEAVEVMNELARHTVAVDCPTGVDAATGLVGEPCVATGVTVTMGLPKTGLLLWPGSAHVGELVVADIGFPPELLGDPAYQVNVLTRPEVTRALPSRPLNAHKGTCGKLLVVAGSQGYSGAAALTAMAALRAGAGLVYVGVPRSMNDIFEVKLTEAITVPLPDTTERTLAPEASVIIMDWLPRVDALAIGPGLSQNPGTVQLVRDLVHGRHVSVPCVLDADGLNALAPLDSGTMLGRHFVLTPHPGEMSRLTGQDTGEIQRDRVGICGDLARRLDCTVVLKGVPTVICGHAGDVFINRTGNPGMATGGTGDVLTGLIGALLAQGVPPLQAGALAAHLHGCAGDRAAARRGQMGMIAGDLLEELPAVLLDAGPKGRTGS